MVRADGRVERGAAPGLVGAAGGRGSLSLVVFGVLWLETVAGVVVGLGEWGRLDGFSWLAHPVLVVHAVVLVPVVLWFGLVPRLPRAAQRRLAWTVGVGLPLAAAAWFLLGRGDG